MLEKTPCVAGKQIENIPVLTLSQPVISKFVATELALLPHQARKYAAKWDKTHYSYERTPRKKS